MTESTFLTEDSLDTDLLKEIMETYNVDFHTLYVTIADCKKSELTAAGKHPQHQPSKKAANPVLPPPGDVC
jgi:hypothetical protein